MNAEDFYTMSKTKSHFEFDRYLREIIRRPEEREEFYTAILEKNIDLSRDLFETYFEDYAAERKKNAQDFTPDCVASLLAEIATAKKEKGWTIYDGAAGSGALLVAAWERLGRASGIMIHACEVSDNAIPYLVHNLNLRKINAAVIQGDTLERHAKQVYRLVNGTINILPHDKKVEEEYDVRSWEEEDQRYFESEDIRREYET